jgi:hypothetical protein
MRVADRIRAALGDSGEKCLSGERPVDAESGLRLNPAMPHMNRYSTPDRTPLTR